ncbi:MAG: SurA N-terminal domain-containing protein [Holosporaceae bacterium]|jgi:DNA-binding phage protein|nr:SurA N-terminal domain-containing protein [Holosporaceae bacterium]
MLEFIRKYSNSLGVKIFLAILALTFVFCFGISDIIRKYVGKDYVVKIGGVKISAPMFELEKAKKFSMLRGYQRNMDEKAETARVLHQLIWETIVDLEAANLGFIVSDETVKKYIGSMSLFRDKNGRFSSEMLRNFIQRIGISEQMFIEFSRKDIKNSLLKMPFYYMSARNELDSYAKAKLEKRTLVLVELNPSSFDPKAKEAPDSAALHEFYEKNPGLFTADEKRSFRILGMPLSALEKNITISEDDKKHYYETNCDKESRSYADSEKEIEAELKQEALRKEEEAFIRDAEDMIMSGAGVEEVVKKFGMNIASIENASLSDKNEKFKIQLNENSWKDALNVAFSTEDGSNSSFAEGVNSKGERIVWMVHVDRIIPKHVEDFSKISENVKTQWIKNKRYQMAEEMAKTFVEQVKSGEQLAAVASKNGCVSVITQQFDRNGKIDNVKDSRFSNIVSQLYSNSFEMSKNDAAYREIDGVIVVYKVRDVIYPDNVDEKNRQSSHAELIREIVDDMYQQLVGFLSKQRYEIKINHEMLMGKDGKTIDFDMDMF